MRIVQLAAEFAPIAKAGGLGEVIVGLSRELTRIHEDVEVIIPKYDFIDTKKLANLRMEVPDFKCYEKGNLHPNTMWSAQCEGCNLHLLEARHPAGYFHRGKIYGGEDEKARFIYFSRAVLEYLKLKNEPIDILHLHDWHVSICAPLVRDLFANDLKIKSILLTVHNSEYQGKCAPHDLDNIGLKSANYLTKEKMLDDDPETPKAVNLMKGGIVYADEVVAVSPTYSKELLTPEMGFHLESTFRKYKGKITGILNGIDQKIWDPSIDPSLKGHFNSESSFAAIQNGKKENKKELQKRFKLAGDRTPWIGAVTRLVPQKGPELIEEAVKKTVELGGTFLLLGSTDLPKMKELFDQLKKQYASSNQAFLQFEYNEELAHLIYAACDFTVVPSHFEPCGLTQLIAMRYGSIPIVRSTGGLKDTVFDCEDPTVPMQKRNGFTFQKISPDALDSALKRAFHLYRSDPATFQSIVRRAIQLDFSWKKPAQEYLKLYRKLASVKIQKNSIAV